MNRSARITLQMATATYCSFIALTSVAQDDRCGVFKNGVFDETSNTVEISHTYGSFDWICSDEIKTAQDVDSKSAELEVPVKGVPVDLGWKKDEQSFSAWKLSFCKTKSVDNNYRAKQAQLIKRASQILVDGFNACINAPGVHVWPSPASAGEAAFSAKFVPLEEGQTSANMNVKSSQGVTCNPSALKLTRATTHIICTRSVIKPQVVYFSSNVFNVVPGSFALPGPPPVAPPAKPCDDVPNGPTAIAFTKFAPAQKHLGPYCVPVTVTLRASGQAHRNSSGVPSSIVTIYSTATPSGKSLVCSGGVTPLGNEVGKIRVSCPSFSIPAYRTTAYSVNVNDSSADTYNLEWILDVKPTDGQRYLPPQQ